MSARIALPERVFAHGFINVKGEKMSKSVGNVVDPIALIEAFGLDQVRYFFLREVSFGQDGSYSEEAIIGRINADLANELGNLAQRSLSMVNKNLAGIVPTPGEFTAADLELLKQADGLMETVRGHYDVPAMHLALEAVWLMLGAANRYFSAEEPWVLRKSAEAADQERFGTVLYTTLEAVRIAALLVQPVMPTSAAKLLDLLGQSATERDFTAIGTRLQPGTSLPTPEGVFPRYQAETKE
jgi:methionyl-tRNA synthetase